MALRPEVYRFPLRSCISEEALSWLSPLPIKSTEMHSQFIYAFTLISKVRICKMKMNYCW
jgi:hypothetical protein